MQEQDWRTPLLGWYEATKRDLPWRRTSSAYAVWVSEIMLQQTQVATVISYFERWMEAFPQVEDLAAADEQAVLAHWAGLGYYRRARMLHAGAMEIVRNGWPQTESEWLRVPGVGRYTAGAIASIALGQPAALVDGNVERVFSRLNDVSESGPKLHKLAWDWAKTNLVADRPGDWNQALMELGATVCTPRQPSCLLCPLNGSCRALAAGTVDQRPVASPKPTKKHMAFLVLARANRNGAALQQIPKGAWWEGMWEFERQALGTDPPPPHDFVVKHVVTNHQITLYVRFENLAEDANLMDWKAIERLPIPAPQMKIIRRLRKDFV